MLKSGRTSVCRAIKVMIALLMILSPVFAATSSHAEKRTIKAFWIAELPADHDAVEKLFLSYRDAGADTVVVGPLSTAGPLTIKVLPHIVFLAHKTRLKIYVTVSTRRDVELLRSHPQWEDRRYDLESRSLKTEAALDLFRPEVVAHLVNTVQNIARYSVDGILMDEDFTYEETDGMSREVFAAYQKKYAKEPVPKKLFVKVERMGTSYRVAEYGEGFENLIRMKLDRLGEVFKALKDASRSENRDVQFGVPLRFSGYENILGTLPHYTRLVRAFKRAEPDFYWIVIPHRDKEGLSYKQGMESVARAAKIIATAVEEKDKAVVVLSMMNKDGRLLAYTELEEATDMVRTSGISSVVYRVKKELGLPVPITRKLFNTQNE
ncbi:MAG TPA: family 10 glycosylhydrolase [Nitrospirota bacterium]|nr:family 10 glycosylhydrolase [Nitrospirota bacterium]